MLDAEDDANDPTVQRARRLDELIARSKALYAPQTTSGTEGAMNEEPYLTVEDRRRGPVPILLHDPNGRSQVLVVKHAPWRLTFQVGLRSCIYEVHGLTNKGVLVYMPVVTRDGSR